MEEQAEKKISPVEAKDRIEQSGRENGIKKKRPVFGNLFLRVSLQEKVMFARHLAVGIKSGMTLQDALALIKKQARSGSLKKILDTVIQDTTGGMFLSASLEKYHNVFGDLFINVLKVAESSGTLTENLNYLAEELKKKQSLRSKIRGAMIYPIIILIATVGIVSTLMIGIFPKILPVFANLNINLPITTRMLIATSKFMTANLVWLIIGLVLFVILIWILSHYFFFKHAWHHLLSKTPMIKSISAKVNAANLSRTLGLLLRSGVRIIEAVNITAESLDNTVYRHELKNAGETLRRGEFFSAYLAKFPKLFPPVLVNMIEVGENTGNLTENLEYLAEFYQGEVEDILKNLSSIIEPILLLFMGLLVGFIALSVITPIYQISQSLTL